MYKSTSTIFTAGMTLRDIQNFLLNQLNSPFDRSPIEIVAVPHDNDKRFVGFEARIKNNPWVMNYSVLKFKEEYYQTVKNVLANFGFHFVEFSNEGRKIRVKIFN